jgi:hypothetical protein
VVMVYSNCINYPPSLLELHVFLNMLSHASRFPFCTMRSFKGKIKGSGLHSLPYSSVAYMATTTLFRLLKRLFIRRQTHSVTHILMGERLANNTSMILSWFFELICSGQWYRHRVTCSMRVEPWACAKANGHHRSLFYSAEAYVACPGTNLGPGEDCRRHLLMPPPGESATRAT